MKKFIVKYCFLYLLCLLAAPPLWAQRLKDIIKRPPETKLVHDFTGKLSGFQKQHLEDKLKKYDDTTSNNIAIVLVNTLDGYTVEDAATELFRNWGIGQKKTNNGVLILAAIEDRKVRIEVGYGLEGAVSDYTCGEIIDNDIKPNFKAGLYYEGLEAATNSIILAAEGRYKAPEGYAKRGKGTDGKFVGLMIMMFVVFFVLVAISRRGGNNGGMMSRRGYHDWSGGGPIITNWGGGGSSSGGGGGWSGGGGFGGFGGGSSGGGGASGDW